MQNDLKPQAEKSYEEVLGAHFIGTATSEMAGQAMLAIQMEVILTGGKRRLRPILMTTLTTCLALVPMALGFGEGSEMNAPMARVMIGGMLVSALFTIFFVPTLYGSIKGIGRSDSIKET